MSNILTPDQTGRVPRMSANSIRRLRALRAAGEARAGQYSSPPTGWGRWPTCACPRDNRMADGSCC